MSKFLIFFLFFINTFTVNGWGFKKNNTHTTPSIGSFEKILEGTDSYYVGDTNEKVVYLTFDVGYDNGNLNDILDTLDKYNVRGTFFLTGDFVNRYHDLVIRLSLSNHLICNHSYGHKNITKLSKEIYLPSKSSTFFSKSSFSLADVDNNCSLNSVKLFNNS